MINSWNLLGSTIRCANLLLTGFRAERTSLHQNRRALVGVRSSQHPQHKCPYASDFDHAISRLTHRTNPVRDSLSGRLRRTPLPATLRTGHRHRHRDVHLLTMASATARASSSFRMVRVSSPDVCSVWTAQHNKQHRVLAHGWPACECGSRLAALRRSSGVRRKVYEQRDRGARVRFDQRKERLPCGVVLSLFLVSSLICYYYYWLLCCRWYVMLSVWMLRRKTHRSPAPINRWSVSWRIVNTLHSTEVESRIMRS